MKEIIENTIFFLEFKKSLIKKHYHEKQMNSIFNYFDDLRLELDQQDRLIAILKNFF